MPKTHEEAAKEAGYLAFEKFDDERPKMLYRITHRGLRGLRCTNYYDDPLAAGNALSFIEDQGYELIGVWEYEMTDLPLSCHPQ